MQRSRRLITTIVVGVLLAAIMPTSFAADADGWLPLGDGKTSTTIPKKGWIYVCRIVTGGGGATGATPWISGDHWNPAAKPSVAGSVRWQQAALSFSTTNSVRTITTTGVPTDAVTGTFPIAQSDPVYVYDRNPNSITPKSIAVKVPRYPKIASKPGCLSLGAIGYTVNGVAIFNGLDAENRDAVAHEVQDVCDGHPERSGQYHYHSGSRCAVTKAIGSSTLYGYALDGFGIYIERTADGALLTNDDLDICHGRTSTVLFNGKRQKMYHYVITAEYPYTLGCYRGTPLASTLAGQTQANPPMRPGGPPPGGGPGGPPPPTP
jgi:hypothetical protein